VVGIAEHRSVTALPRPAERRQALLPLRFRRFAISSLFLVTYAAVIAWLLQGSYDVAGGVLVAHLLAVPTVPMIIRATRREDDTWLRKLIVVAILAKLVGTFLRFAVELSVYEGGTDALRRYDRVGKELAESGFSEIGQLTGTRVIEVSTGLLYRIIGPTSVGGFLVYSWLGFWGLYLFYRAFSLVFPGGDRRRYAVLVFFLPSLLFWPSSIGKDAWMALGLGLIAYGAAGLWSPQRQRWSAQVLMLGVVSTMMVRPHITVTAMVSLTVAYLISRSRRASRSAPLSRMAGAIALLLVLGFVVASFRNYFQLDTVNAKSVDGVLEQATTRSSDAGSEFALAAIVLVLLLVQMGVGEIQWRNRLPWGVVLVHVMLATAVWAGVVALAARLFLSPARP
jgi:hypothetical protein